MKRRVLYVMGQTPKSLAVFTNLKQICEAHLKGRYRITVIDLVKQPQLAKGDQILAVPTVVRKLPKPVRIIIGNLSVIDIYQQPELARANQIVATPTLIKVFPRPVRRFIGNLLNTTGPFAELDLPPKVKAAL